MFFLLRLLGKLNKNKFVDSFALVLPGLYIVKPKKDRAGNLSQNTVVFASLENRCT